MLRLLYHFVCGQMCETKKIICSIEIANFSYGPHIIGLVYFPICFFFLHLVYRRKRSVSVAVNALAVKRKTIVVIVHHAVTTKVIRFANSAVAKSSPTKRYVNVKSIRTSNELHFHFYCSGSYCYLIFLCVAFCVCGYFLSLGFCLIVKCS